MKVTIEVEMNNDAFDDGFNGLRELHRLLNLAVEKVGDQMSRSPSLCNHPESADKLLDKNGNTVGTVQWQP